MKPNPQALISLLKSLRQIEGLRLIQTDHANIASIAQYSDDELRAVRDLLVGDTPVVWLRSPAFLFNAATTALLAFFIARLWKLPRQVLLVADAFALALFTIIGARKGMALHLSAPVAVLLGVVTGVAGGILRDVLIGEVPLVFQPEIHLYATAALAGGIAFTMLRAAGVTEPMTTVVGVALVFGLRLAGIHWRLSLPVFESPEPIDSRGK